MRKHYLFLFFLLSMFTQTLYAEGNFVKSDFFASIQPGEKAAILTVHFGTTHDDTRQVTIDAINKRIAEEFPGIEVREAWTSRIILYRLKKRGINKQTPEEALAALKSEGYTHILIQSTNIIDGIEMEALRKEAAAHEKDFKEIRIGTPLLFSPNDYETVIKAITSKGAKKGAVLLIGHGTYTPITAQYTMLDYMLKMKGFEQYAVGTIEGYPSFDEAVVHIRKTGSKEVQLMPLMFVAGEHAKNDIAEDWKSDLEKEGFTVSVLLKGLGENPAIQDLFIEHIRFAATHKYMDIMQKKKEYATGKEKYE